MNKETRQFIAENIEADIHQLAFQAARYPMVNMAFAICQINGMQKVKAKIPLFFNTEDVLYPVQLSLEQSSSESTAKYKHTLCEGNSLTDLTGGFGVDCCFMSEGFKHVTYVERQKELCELATHNFKVLGKNQIEVIHSETEKYLSGMSRVDWIFIDPARRSSSGKKVVLLSDCEPDVAALSNELLAKATKVMIKLSPMMDITAAIRELDTASEVHILSVDNECKEVLLILNQSAPQNIRIKAVNLLKNEKIQLFEFHLNEESSARVTYTQKIEKYLYEPNASLMKSGAFKTVSQYFGIHKLHYNTNLYTSSELLLHFPGRIFETVKTWGNSKVEHKELALHLPKANIATRNYPISVDELRKKLKIKEGGDTYLFACTLANEQKIIVECRKCF